MLALVTHRVDPLILPNFLKSSSRNLKLHLFPVRINNRTKQGRSKSITINNIGSFGGYGLPLVPPPPPEPVKFPRKRLNQRFAVLLLRSTYETVDALDFIAMDQFQKKFWKLRQSEYEPYTIQYLPIKFTQGELSDPLYFDFISFAQHLTISNQIPDSPQVFTEREGADGGERVVRRAQQYQDNTRLPVELGLLAGDLVYQGISQGFQDAVFNGPLPCASPSFDCALAGVKRLAEVFMENGYCIKANVTDIEKSSTTSGTFKVRYEGTATLWSVAALASRRSIVKNGYTANTTSAFLRASGFQNSSFNVKNTDTSIEEVWTIL
mmetsp:Transcript_21884/g.30443  ORF Transcript_21884/g.30443 Transcript_21884/m.30443 type:complete len:323 (+) Transcript_21884:35-1003(+)|eukprot:CAMPEP_0196585806 /NCGR_PEP_ID=MMETSP1081-20130531/52094_1 /TAXON_ID=36882 /ORGANISM="Pyramimonas amylifera, Strain CCMP720" /LENGTH=322 /DNA_ID=CAMNT_0041907477 /DNA_START=35 /DNA_END=1003 /DNA_ORIENTATION=-